MPRFVVLLHEMASGPRGPVHWDLMLEHDGVLVTWALAQKPKSDHTIEADRLADHRLDYLTYEGPISGDRGTVSRFDSGEYKVVFSSEDRWMIEVKGRFLKGTIQLLRQPGNAHRWIFSFST